MSTTIAPTLYAVLAPIGGAPRAQVCSLHTTHVGAHRHLSPGRVVGPVPATTCVLDNVPLTTTKGAIARGSRVPVSLALAVCTLESGVGTRGAILCGCYVRGPSGAVDRSAAAQARPLWPAPMMATSRI